LFIKKVGKLDEYQATTKLTPGPHTYAFQFGDGTNSWQLPLNSVPFTGPQVMPFDLTGLKVTPSTGGQQLGQPVTVSVTYKSPAGKTPVTAQIDIDNKVHQLHLLYDLHRPGPGDRGGRGGERDLPFR
jgi:hypothetical protein